MRVERVKGEINSYERKYFGYLAVESSKKWENGGRENKHRERERDGRERIQRVRKKRGDSQIGRVRIQAERRQ